MNIKKETNNLKYPLSRNILYILILTAACISAFFLNIAEYPFIEAAESKFALIAKDMLNSGSWTDISLHGEPFFDIQPLYFWLVNLSCIFFGKISQEALRLPVSIAAAAGVFILYFGLKRIFTKTYAFITAMIFISSFGVLLAARFSSPDISAAISALTAVLSGYNAVFAKKYKPLMYALMYLFSAFSVLSGGIFGIIPVIAVFLIHILSGSIKEFFKPLNFIFGFVLFLAIAAPWHLFMLYKHGSGYICSFFEASAAVSPFNAEIPVTVLLLSAAAFFPWVFSFAAVLIAASNDKNSKYFLYCNSVYSLKERWAELKKSERFIAANIALFVITLIPALIFGLKYPFLILLLIFPASCISGVFWYRYITKIQHRKSIFISSVIFNLILILFSLFILFAYNTRLYEGLQGLKNILAPLVFVFFIIPVINIFTVIVKGKKTAFSANIVLMLSLSFMLPEILNFACSISGENSLVRFALEARMNDAPLAAYISSNKNSIEYYYDNPVEFKGRFEEKEVLNFLRENPDAYVIAEIKDMLLLESKQAGGYELLDSGWKYCLIQYKQNPQEEEIIEEAPAAESENIKKDDAPAEKKEEAPAPKIEAAKQDDASEHQEAETPEIKQPVKVQRAEKKQHRNRADKASKPVRAQKIEVPDKFMQKDETEPESLFIREEILRKRESILNNQNSETEEKAPAEEKPAKPDIQLPLEETPAPVEEQASDD